MHVASIRVAACEGIMAIRSGIKTGGFTVAWFIAMFENLTKSVSHMVCLIWKFSRGG